MSTHTAPQMTARDWHALIRSAPNFAQAQDLMEDALRGGVDFAELRAIQAEASR